MTLEIRQPANATSVGHYYIRFNFKNGTADTDFKPYPMIGRVDGDYDVPLTDFNAALTASLSLSRAWAI